VQFPVDGTTFRALPRHPDWAYEHFDGWAHLRYRPRPLELVRDLAPVTPRAGDPDIDHRPAVLTATAADHEELVHLVDLVWDDLDPYRVRRALEGSGPGPAEADTAGLRFARTLAGEDRPWEPGVLVARARAGAGPVAGVVTLGVWPGGDPSGVAQPAITWLTVSPRWRRAGVATALLAAAVAVAGRTGAGELHSAVSGANLPSVCWHWVNGFRPLPRVG
jgi:GNAT superfamily N-acetyltransferase